MKIINENMGRIIEICNRFHVTHLWVFGSILTPRFSKDSDIDILVEFDRSKINLLDMADVFFGFIDEMESLLKRKIDLTEYSGIKNKYFKEEVDETKKLLWTA